jgi:phosphate transport system protein
MPRESLDQKLNELVDEVLILESMVRKAVMDAVDALCARDFSTSRLIYGSDELINQHRFKIENQTLGVIATQQPMASDLRVLSSVIEVITELERIGDYAKGIARINIMVGDDPLIISMAELPEMVSIASDMLMRATRAFAERDAVTARQIPTEDDKVDQYFIRINQGLINKMLEDPSAIKQANHLQWAAHNIERMADRVTNICERTIFVATGEISELESMDDELVLG